jgi:DNA-binding MarR family transcriptional regulator
LAKLLAARRRGLTGLSLGELAERVGMHYSTLNRDLKPLKREGFIRDARGEGDRRIRTVSITNKGRAKLAEAIPAWRRAQARVQDTLGIEVMLSLNALLDLACAKVTE